MHAGEQAFVILPSDRDEKGNYLFDIKLIGVEGSGKQFDLSSAINERKKSILDSFGAGFMSLGNEGGGSHALMDGKTTVHEAFVGRDVDFIISVIERELFPQLLALNGIILPQKKMPKVKAGNISETSIDEVSKMIQRVFAVGGVPFTKKVAQKNLDMLGYEVDIEDMSEDEFQKYLPESVTRAGDGMKSGTGNGTGNGDSGDDANTGNLER
jgi:hypothetical protein